MIYKVTIEKTAFVEAENKEEAAEMYWDGYDVFNEEERIKKVVLQKDE